MKPYWRNSLFVMIVSVFMLAFSPIIKANSGDSTSPAAVATSYQTVSFKANDIEIASASGSTGLSDISVSTPGASYRSDFDTYWITQTNSPGIEINFTASASTLVQVQLRVAYVINSGAQDSFSMLDVTLNGTEVQGENQKITNSSWHTVVIELPIDQVKAGSNRLELSLPQNSAPLFVQTAKLMPRNIYAQNGVLDTTIYAQFGSTSHITGIQTQDKKTTTDVKTIWTRAYGLEETTELIPGPTLFYKAGDLLRVNLINELNNTVLDELTNLGQFENDEAANLAANNDETLANLNDAVRQEVNIPHNLNNTNLHVHGLHVDPEKDDVTIVVVPTSEADTVGEYDAPPKLPTTREDLLCTVDEGSVADQPVKPGSWQYEYRLPANHLPGSHWFHPHKHGSTAAQVENGMAGSMVIQEPEELAIFPDNLDDEWSQTHDRVMMIQQIANYGLQQGSGGQNSSTTPVTVVNGKHQPSYTFAPGQIQRWRFVNAGANHRAFNHMWLGVNTGLVDSNNHPVYKSQAMHAVAFDGITTDKKTEVTAASPLLLAPGNRTDVLFQVPSDADNNTEYSIFKYYPQGISIVSDDFDLTGVQSKSTALDDHLVWACDNAKKPSNVKCGHGSGVGPLTPAFQHISNPYLLVPNNLSDLATGSNSYPRNYGQFEKEWFLVNGDVSQAPNPNDTASISVMPLIKVAPDSGSGLLNLDFALSGQFPSGDCGSAGPSAPCSDSAGKWQPVFDGGGQAASEMLLTVTVDTSKTPIGPLSLPTDSYLSSIAVVGDFSSGKTAPGFDGEIPPYVSQISDVDVLQSRPVIFDKSGAAIKVTDSENTQNSVGVNQFTLNGRLFALNDMIGNSTDTVNHRLMQSFTADELKRVETSNSDSKSAVGEGQCDKTEDTSCLDIEETLSFTGSGLNRVWINGVCEDGSCSNDNDLSYYWANPGYFQDLVYSEDAGGYGYAAATDKKPDWEKVSGLTEPASVNPNHRYGDIHGSVNDIPGLPVATTGEEWVFVNNSDIGHPFHIHINPFFVMEVGQLSYEQFADKKDWVMRGVSYDNSLPSLDNTGNAPTSPGVYATDMAVPGIVGNWWDTIIVPPHGYIRMRYWMNVPDQTGSGEAAVVQDDANKIGIWVFHCHILRHEDRGMMMPMITQRMTDTPPPAGPVNCPAVPTRGHSH